MTAKITTTTKEKESVFLSHPFEPLFDAESRILILGSFPSVKSREQNFFYGHPQNRFWRVLAQVFSEDAAPAGFAASGGVNAGGKNAAHGGGIGGGKKAAPGGLETPELYVPRSIEEKRSFLHQHHVALWDVIYSCRIHGSSDASIRDAVPTDLRRVLENSRVNRIFVNGQTAFKLYQKHQQQLIELPAAVLPSTSPANAVWSVERLTEAWKVILEEPD